MSEVKKIKISLNDYDYKSDIQNRLLMSQFSTLDVLVLEEILYSPLKISLKKLAKNLDIQDDDLISILKKFHRVGLLSFQNDEILVDKEMRKYFEMRILQFEEGFFPNMEFLQGILKKVPIQILPLWYSIPRTSNNIFDSLIEKYLLTPHLFQRSVCEIPFNDPILEEIVKEVYSSPNFKVFGSDLMTKFSLSQEQFEENMLLLEFHFLCCLSYEKIGNAWKEIVTPFQEWRDYLSFLRNTETHSLDPEAKIQRSSTSCFDFVEHLANFLRSIEKEDFSANEATLQEKTFVDKLQLLKFIDTVENKFCLLEGAHEWLNMSVENRALFIYRYPLNRIFLGGNLSYLCSEKTVREAEKSIQRVLGKGWVYFDDFIQGVLVPLNEHSIITLKKFGKSWKYTLPEYTTEEKELIKATIFEWLPEVGITATGTHEGKDCFCVTPFGESIFDSR